MEYLRDRGPAADVPVAEIQEVFRRCYPNLTMEMAAAPASQFRTEAAEPRERGEGA